MSKKETTNPKEVRNQNYEAKRMNTFEKSNKKKNKDLPWWVELLFCLLYTSPSPRDRTRSRMPSSA